MAAQNKEPVMGECVVETWQNCYDLTCGASSSFQKHSPILESAKMSRGLLERIIDYGLTQGFWSRDSILLDCFGGVGTTGLVAAWHGLACVRTGRRFIGIELERKYFAIARRRIEAEMDSQPLLKDVEPMPVQSELFG